MAMSDSANGLAEEAKGLYDLSDSVSSVAEQMARNMSAIAGAMEESNTVFHSSL